MTDETTTYQSLPPTDTDPETVETVRGPYHDFWLFGEGEVEYLQYWDYLGREDAPIRLPMDVYDYLHEALSWLPTIYPSRRIVYPAQGLDYYGATVINREGGEQFAQVCAG